MSSPPRKPRAPFENRSPSHEKKKHERAEDRFPQKEISDFKGGWDQRENVQNQATNVSQIPNFSQFASFKQALETSRGRNKDK